MRKYSVQTIDWVQKHSFSTTYQLGANMKSSKIYLEVFFIKKRCPTTVGVFDHKS